MVRESKEKRLDKELEELRERIKSLEAENSELKSLESMMKIDFEFSKNVFETIREPLLILNGNLKVISANRSFYKIFRVTPDETIGQFIYDLGNRQWDIPRLRELLEEIIPNNTKFDGFEVEHEFPSIGRKMMVLNARRVYKSWDLEQSILLAIEDITERKRAEEKVQHLNQVLRAIRNINQLIVREKDPKALLEGACNLLEKARNYRLVWIGKLEEKEKLVIPFVFSGEGSQYLSNIKITFDDTETGKGPEGTAVRIRRPDICQDISQDPRMKPWRDMAQRYGFSSSSAFPIIIGDKIYGILNVYSGQKDAFVPEETELLKEISDDLALALKSIELEKERGEAEAKLLGTKRSLEAILDTVPALIVLTNSEGGIEMFNRACEELTGYREDEVLGRKIIELFIPPQWLDTVQKRFENPLSPELRLPHENPWKTRSGEERLIEWRCATLQSPLDKKPWILGIGIDITEHKKQEESLRKSEEMYRSLFMRIPIGLYRTSPSGEILDANPALSDILGFEDADSLIGINATIFYDDPEDQKKQERLMEEDGIIIDYEMPLRRRDGHLIWVRDNTRAVYNEKGERIYHEGSLIDITEQKKAIDEIRKSEERYRALVEGSIDGILMMDKERNILSCNSSLCKLFGYEEDELMGKSTRIFHPSDESFYSFGSLAYPRVKSMGYFKGEWGLIRRDGAEIPVEMAISPIRETDGRITGYISIVRDITERKKAEKEKSELEAQLRQSQKMEAIALLAGGVAHDFNNILSVIMGNCDLCLLDLPTKDPIRANIEEIKNASRRAADLTRQLLAFCGRQILEPKVIDLNSLIKNLEKMLLRIIGEDIELYTFLSEDLGRIKADPGQIEQVILNLTVNARDAMPRGGKFTIETSNANLDEEYARKHVGVAPGSYIMLSITDTGTGMPPEVKERIFEPFFTTKEKGKGTGLGLSTVYGIVKQSGGNIWVYSELGQGTTFKVYFPKVEEPAHKLEEKIVSPEILGGNETILLVEDDETVRKLALRILKKQGYNVLEASGGGEALIICENYKETIHLILTDVVMPRMSGKELVERLMLIHPEMKVLYMSGYTDNVIAVHGILEKGIEYIQKPFTVEGLARKVREVLDKNPPL